MRDPYLEAMLKGEGPKKGAKDRFEIALDKSINEYLDTFSFDEEPGQLISPLAKRKKIGEELKESLTHSELNDYLITAVQVIKRDGKQYVEKEIYSKLLEEFTNANQILNTMGLEQTLTEDFSQILHLSSETITSLFNIAVAKFKEESFYDSLAIFVLLTVLQPDEFDFWYRTAIAAQACENYSLALDYYSIALILNPELIEARLFSVECYLKQGRASEAKQEYNEVEKLPLSDDNQNLLIYVKSLFDAS